MAKITIGDGIEIARLNLETNKTIAEAILSSSDFVVNEITDPKLKTAYENIQNIGFNNVEWNDNSVFIANMNNTYKGMSYDLSKASQKNELNWNRLRIYKTIGNDKDKQYFVYETSGMNELYIEDFVVGDMCNYKYYIYPISLSSIEEDSGNSVAVEKIDTAFESGDINLREGAFTVVGLIKSNEEENTYYIDTKNNWIFTMNMSDEGTALVTNKNYSDTQNKYQQATSSVRGYKTKSFSGLIGKFDCADKKYVDTFEKLEAWDAFCLSNSLKMLIDLRGRILIGDFDNNPSIDYEENNVEMARVSFNFKELTDIDNIKIINKGYSSLNHNNTIKITDWKNLYDELLSKYNSFVNNTDASLKEIINKQNYFIDGGAE